MSHARSAQTVVWKHPTLCLIPLRPTGLQPDPGDGTMEGDTGFLGKPINTIHGGAQSLHEQSVTSHGFIPWLLFSLCVLLFCNSSIQKSGQHQIWAKGDSPTEYDKRPGIKMRWLLQVQGQILSLFKTFYFVQHGFGGINFLKIFHKMLFTLITEFNWTPLSFVLEVHAHLHHLSSMFWSLLHIKIWFKQEQAKLMFLQWVPTDFREWYPEVMKDRHVLSQYLGEMVRNFCGFDSSGPLLKDIFIHKV